MRFFNTAGPVNSNDHYTLSPLKRFDLEDIELLIDQKKYFILHAPRQTGKTTSLNALADHLNKKSVYASVYINVEPAQAARENVEQAMRAILSRLASQIKWLFNDSFFQENWESVLNSSGPFAAFVEMVAQWCEHMEKPVVLLIDEIDSLVGDTLISILRQIREGYNNRPARFPSSIILCGVRDIRDYRIHSDMEKSIITGGSAFNIKAKSLRLGGFTENETAELMVQHEQETGQKFTANA
ncbi:MAG: ATP-binding protein, partial [Thermodesulfobacteriota bacterium]|nr:ATP-binding protein [Thermodesulfobacteriota bacterium]